MMRALELPRPVADAREHPLRLVDVEPPALEVGEVLIRVTVCGMCRTDLDLVEGRLVAPKYPVIPGHQVIGRVVATNAPGAGVREGQRVGLAWIHSACGGCRWCQAGEENLCPEFRSTGCDTNGGYAELVTAPGDFVYAIPDALSDPQAAPLLCAGAIGWRSLRLARLAEGEPLGLVGFGASGHLVLQLARRRHPRSPVFVFARSAAEREFAAALGAAWTGDSTDTPPDRMGGVIDTTPAWKPMVDTLPHLAPGGRYVINAIRKEETDRSTLSRVVYERHLWMEREIKSVANVTRRDVREMLQMAAEWTIRPTVTEVAFTEANAALARLRGAGSIRGATVLRVAMA